MNTTPLTFKPIPTLPEELIRWLYQRHDERERLMEICESVNNSYHLHAAKVSLHKAPPFGWVSALELVAKLGLFLALNPAFFAAAQGAIDLYTGVVVEKEVEVSTCDWLCQNCNEIIHVKAGVTLRACPLCDSMKVGLFFFSGLMEAIEQAGTVAGADIDYLDMDPDGQADDEAGYVE